MQHKKILFIINSLGYGGAETQIIKMIDTLIVKNYKVSIISLSNDIPLKNRLNKKCKLHIVNFNKYNFIFQIFRLLKLVSKESPKVIHSHLFQANILSRVIKIFNKKIKIINTSHGAYLLNIRKYNPYKIYKYTKKYVDFHSGVSHQVLNLLHTNNSISITKSDYIPNGLDISSFDKKKSEHKTPLKLIAVGRMHQVKGFDLLIKSIHEVKKLNYDIRLDIAGDGEDFEKLNNIINDLKLNKEVTLLGMVDNVDSLMKNYDALIISSYSEGLPMVLLEAMSVKLPVISTDVGEISKIINQSKGGIIIKDNNTIHLVNGIIKFAKLSSSEINQFGENNYKFVNDNYAIDNIINRWIKIYFE